MNKAYLMGRIVEKPRLVNVGTMPNHLVFALEVEHRTKTTGKREHYLVNAWHGLAIWGADRLTEGQIVLVDGYLTQRVRPDGVVQVQVTASRFYPQAAGQSKSEAKAS